MLLVLRGSGIFTALGYTAGVPGRRWLSSGSGRRASSSAGAALVEEDAVASIGVADADPIGHAAAHCDGHGGGATGSPAGSNVCLPAVEMKVPSGGIVPVEAGGSSGAWRRGRAVVEGRPELVPHSRARCPRHVVGAGGQRLDARRAGHPPAGQELANGLSALASPVLVYALGLGLVGSAIANVAAQVIAGMLFLRAIRAERRPWRPRRAVMVGQLVAGRDLLARQAGFQAALLTAAAVAARMGTAQLAAHQVGLECWELTALLLGSFAIAAQSLVGAALGGGDARQARGVAWQVARYGAAAGALFMLLLLGAGWWLVPAAFTSSAAVRHQVHLLWPFLAGMQPAAGIVFALDGVLIGAGDVRFLRSLTLVATVGVYAPVALAALRWHWGIEGAWAGLAASILTRLAGMLVRTARGRWAIIGTG